MSERFQPRRNPRAGLGRSRQGGMTLIELLIALVIVGILTSVALPLYGRYQERTYATQAMADLGVCAQALERHYTVNYTYGGAADDGAGGTQDAGAPVICPAASPPRGQPLFNLAITVANANAFTLRATPIAGQAAATVGLLEIDATGVRRWDRDGNGNFTAAGEDNWDF